MKTPLTTAEPIWGVPPKRENLLLGLDLGQSRDFTALIVAARTESHDGAVYTIDHAERWRGERYPKLVKTVKSRITALKNAAPSDPRLQPDIRLIVDATGVGRPIVDQFLEAELGCAVTALTITGGVAVSRNTDGYGVPKRDLAATIQKLLHAGRLRIAKDLPLTPVLSKELENFRVRISLSGHDTYAAGNVLDWREEDSHDDLTLAVGMACWAGVQEHDSWSDIAAEGFDLGAFFASR